MAFQSGCQQTRPLWGTDPCKSWMCGPELQAPGLSTPGSAVLQPPSRPWPRRGIQLLTLAGTWPSPTAASLTPHPEGHLLCGELTAGSDGSTRTCAVTEVSSGRAGGQGRLPGGSAIHAETSAPAPLRAASLAQVPAPQELRAPGRGSFPWARPLQRAELRAPWTFSPVIFAQVSSAHAAPWCRPCGLRRRNPAAPGHPQELHNRTSQT